MDISKGKFSTVDSWPLMGSPLPLSSIFIIYLFLILKVLPQFMSKRAPFKLKKIIQAYNIFQIGASTMIVMGFHYHGFTFKNTWKCVENIKPGEEEGRMLGIHTFWFYGIMLRIVEFLETIFFVLRKKYSQVTFLHIYHHISTIVIFWVFLKYSGSMMELYLGVINSLVHVFMYTYYLLSSVNVSKNLMMSVKPFVTILQLVQFLIILGHCVAAITCGATKLFYIQFPNVFLLICMFVKFFIKTYRRGEEKKKEI